MSLTTRSPAAASVAVTPRVTTGPRPCPRPSPHTTRSALTRALTSAWSLHLTQTRETDLARRPASTRVLLLAGRELLPEPGRQILLATLPRQLLLQTFQKLQRLRQLGIRQRPDVLHHKKPTHPVIGALGRHLHPLVRRLLKPRPQIEAARSHIPVRLPATT